MEPMSTDPIAFEVRNGADQCVHRATTCAELAHAFPHDSRAGLHAVAIMADGSEFPVLFAVDDEYAKQNAVARQLADTACECIDQALSDLLGVFARNDVPQELAFMALLHGTLRATAALVSGVDEALPRLGVRRVAVEGFARLIDSYPEKKPE